MKPPVTLDHLRRMAVARTLFAPTSLQQALERLGFLQADPIRAPARAQDLILRPRVDGYRAGDLDRAYPSLAVAEDVFVNYGFVTRTVQALMHPRGGASRWTPSRRKRAEALLAFVRERGSAHPRDVDRHFAHGTVTNYWGGSSSATTHLLDDMHYRGLLRVVRRESGVRVFGLGEPGAPVNDPEVRRARLDALVDVAVNVYAPVPQRTLAFLVARLRYGAPQWRRHLKAALARAQRRLASARIDGVTWYWPADETPDGDPPSDRVHLLAPFDPLVWDRFRFERFWGWRYRFEAYTPVAKRQLGYYALPLVWRDRAIGWANASVTGGALRVDVGYTDTRPRDRRFARALEEEIERLRVFLGPPGTAI